MNFGLFLRIYPPKCSFPTTPYSSPHCIPPLWLQIGCWMIHKQPSSVAASHVRHDCCASCYSGVFGIVPSAQVYLRLLTVIGMFTSFRTPADFYHDRGACAHVCFRPDRLLVQGTRAIRSQVPRFLIYPGFCRQTWDCQETKRRSRLWLDNPPRNVGCHRVHECSG